MEGEIISIGKEIGIQLPGHYPVYFHPSSMCYYILGMADDYGEDYDVKSLLYDGTLADIVRFGMKIKLLRKRETAFCRYLRRIKY